MKLTKFTNKKIWSKPQIKIRNIVIIFISIFIWFGAISVFAQTPSLQIFTTLTNAIQTIQRIIITNDTNIPLYDINYNSKWWISINLDKLDSEMKKTTQNMPNNRWVVWIDTNKKNLIIIPQNQFSWWWGGINTTVWWRDYILWSNKIVQSFWWLWFGFDALWSFQIDSLAADPSLPLDPLATDRCVYVDNNWSLYAGECLSSYDACLTDPTLCELDPDICTTDPTLCGDICTTDPTLCGDPCLTNPTLCELDPDICTTDPTLCEDICTTDPELCGILWDNLWDHIAMQNIQLWLNWIVYSDLENWESSTDWIFFTESGNVAIWDYLNNLYQYWAKLMIDWDIRIWWSALDDCTPEKEGSIRYVDWCFQACDNFWDNSRVDVAWVGCAANIVRENYCEWNVPTNSIPTAVTQDSTQSRNYDIQPWICTFVCQAWYKYNWATCNWEWFSGTTINNVTWLVQNIINNMTWLTISNITWLVQNIINNMTWLTISNITWLVQNIINNMTWLTISNITWLVQNIVNNMTLSWDNLWNHLATTWLKLNNNRLSNDWDSEWIIVNNSWFVWIWISNPNNTIQVKDLINFNWNNTFLWYQAWLSYIDTMYDYLTAIWHQALFSNTTWFANTAIWHIALYSNTVGWWNTAVWHMSLHDNIIWWYNTAVWIFSLRANIWDRNTAIWDSALERNTSWSQNTAIWVAALYWNIIWNYNTAIWMNALVRNKKWDYNTAIWVAALYWNTSWSDNTAIWKFALFTNISWSDNTAIWAETLINNTWWQYNTAIWSHAGRFSSWSYNVFIWNEAWYNETWNSKLYIANSQSSTLIYWDFHNKKVGINTTSPTDALDVSWSIRSRNLVWNWDRCLYTNSNWVILATWNCNIITQANWTSSWDNLWNHTATTWLKLNNNRISNDWDNEWIIVDNSGNVLFSKSSTTWLWTRFMRLPWKSALRVGTLNSSTREETNIWNNSVVFWKNNKVQSTWSSILWWLTNRIWGIYSDFSSIVWWELNFIMSHHAIIWGWYRNNLFGDYSIIWWWYMNTWVWLYTTIWWGNYNSTMWQSTTIWWWANNNTQWINSTIWWWESNNTQWINSTIWWWSSNRWIWSWSTIWWWIWNAWAWFISLVWWWQWNRAKWNYSSVVWWYSNTSNWTWTIIWWWWANTITWNFWVIWWWNINKILWDFWVIWWWISNSMIWNYWFIWWGRSNKIYSWDYWVIIWWTSNTLTWNYSIILWWSNNSVNWIYSVAAWRLAQVNHDYTALFNLSTATTFSSAKSGTFLVNAPNWVWINTNNPQATLEVNSLLRLTPVQFAPVQCNNNTRWSIYYTNTSNNLCLCKWNERVAIPSWTCPTN